MINIIDNYLPEQTYHNIRNQMLAFNFPWFSSKIVNDSPQNYKRNVQMIHMFYTNHAPQTDHLEIIYPLLDKIQPLSIIKIKANFMTGTDRIVEHGLHNDITEAEDRPYIKTAIYYLNTCDGYTMFEDGTKVESVGNRFVEFPNSMRHTGTSTTDEYRMVLNLNYV